LYSVLNAVMTTNCRVGMGAVQSQIHRYIGFSSYILFSLIFLVNIVAGDLSERSGQTQRRFHPLNWAVVVVLILYQPFMYAQSLRRMESWQTRLRQAKASILLINELPDTLLTKILYPNLSYLTEKSNALDRLGFLRPSLIRTRRLKDFSNNEFDLGKCGFMEGIKFSQNQYAASGWATLPDQGRMPDAIILAYDAGDGDEIAFGLTHPAKMIGGEKAQMGSWQLAFTSDQLPKSQVTIAAWAFDAGTGKAHRLSGTMKIDGR
jgi:hypothetical protein